MVDKKLASSHNLPSVWCEWWARLYRSYVLSVMYKEKCQKTVFSTDNLKEFFQRLGFKPSLASDIDKITGRSENNWFTARLCCHLIHIHCPANYTDMYDAIRNKIHQEMKKLDKDTFLAVRESVDSTLN